MVVPRLSTSPRPRHGDLNTSQLFSKLEIKSVKEDRRKVSSTPSLQYSTPALLYTSDR